MVLQHERQLNPSIIPAPDTASTAPTVLEIQANTTPPPSSTSQG